MLFTQRYILWFLIQIILSVLLSLSCLINEARKIWIFKLEIVRIEDILDVVKHIKSLFVIINNLFHILRIELTMDFHHLKHGFKKFKASIDSREYNCNEEQRIHWINNCTSYFDLFYVNFEGLMKVLFCVISEIYKRREVIFY